MIYAGFMLADADDAEMAEISNLAIVTYWNPHEQEQVDKALSALHVCAKRKLKVMLSVQDIFYRTEKAWDPYWDPKWTEADEWTIRGHHATNDYREALKRFALMQQQIESQGLWPIVKFITVIDEPWTRRYKQDKALVAVELRGIHQFLASQLPRVQRFLNFSGPELWSPWGNLTPQRIIPEPYGDAYGAQVVSFDLYTDTPHTWPQYLGLKGELDKRFPRQLKMLVPDAMLYPHDRLEDKLQRIRQIAEVGFVDPLCLGWLGYGWNSTPEFTGAKAQPEIRRLYAELNAQIMGEIPETEAA